MDYKRLGFYQTNPVKLKNSIKYNYNYNYCPSYIIGVNNSSQYIHTNCYTLLNNNPYFRNLPDNLSLCDISKLSKRSQMIYHNSIDKNWGSQTINRKFWNQQNKIYHSNDQLLQDKIEKIKYEENKRTNKALKNVNPKSLSNGYYNWGNKKNNWYYQNKCEKSKNKMYGNIGINTNVYTGSTYKIKLPNVNQDSVYYNTHSIQEGGIVNKDLWYYYKPNFIKTNRSIYDLGISKNY